MAKTQLKVLGLLIELFAYTYNVHFIKKFLKQSITSEHLQDFFSSAQNIEFRMTDSFRWLKTHQNNRNRKLKFWNDKSRKITLRQCTHNVYLTLFWPFCQIEPLRILQFSCNFGVFSDLLTTKYKLCYIMKKDCILESTLFTVT